VLVQAEGSIERRTARSVVVLASRAPVVLRSTAVAIWDAFSTPRSVSEVASELATAYHSSPETVARDVVPIIRHLLAERALTIAATAP
jgi:hypothetical protein